MVTEKVFSGLQQTAASGKSRWESVREEIELRGYSVLRGIAVGTPLAHIHSATILREDLASWTPAERSRYRRVRSPFPES